MSKTDDLFKGFIEPPLTVGDLLKRLKMMDETTQVFIVEVGNLEGSIKWKRKETYKQWCKKVSGEPNGG